MARNASKYQFETSPRKLEPTYIPKKKIAPKKHNTNKQTKQKKKTTTVVNKQKQLEKKAVKYLIIGFTIVFAIAFRNSKIDESFAKMQGLKDELSEIQKQNVQLEIAIENAMNLNNIEQQAKSLLGMQKLSNRQTVYVDFPKEDYIEVASEKVLLEENNSIFSKVKNWINSL